MDDPLYTKRNFLRACKEGKRLERWFQTVRCAGTFEWSDGNYLPFNLDLTQITDVDIQGFDIKIERFLRSNRRDLWYVQVKNEL